jgi:hypothetical protein
MGLGQVWSEENEAEAAAGGAAGRREHHEEVEEVEARGAGEVTLPAETPVAGASAMRVQDERRPDASGIARSPEEGAPVEQPRGNPAANARVRAARDPVAQPPAEVSLQPVDEETDRTPSFEGHFQAVLAVLAFGHLAFDHGSRAKRETALRRGKINCAAADPQVAR